jgi:hypothetical protein
MTNRSDAGDPRDTRFDGIVVTVEHPGGPVDVSLREWMTTGPGPRDLVDVSAARGPDGRPCRLSVVPLRYRNNRRARLLRRLGLLDNPWA